MAAQGVEDVYASVSYSTLVDVMFSSLEIFFQVEICARRVRETLAEAR